MSSKILKIEQLPDSEARIDAEISADALAHARTHAIKHLNKSFSVPGFRKGALPESMLVCQLGEGQILAEAATIALDKELRTIIAESKLRSITRPSISITKLEPGSPLLFSATLVLEPIFTLPDYKKIVTELPHAEEASKEATEKRRVQIVDALVAATEITLPNKFVDEEVNHVLSHFKHDLSHAGITWEDYLKKVEKTEEEVKETWREHVISRGKMEFILSKIAEQENFKTYPEVISFLEKLS